MSSNEDEARDSNDLQGTKKRRIQRACDICRRKKIRCSEDAKKLLKRPRITGDGSQKPGNRCSSCVANNFDCTYVEAAKKRGPPKGYVESLENRLEKVEKLLKKLYPDNDFTKEWEGSHDREHWITDSVPAPLDSSRPTAALGIQPESPSMSVPDDIDDLDDLMDNAQHLAINDQATDRFFGKSSDAMFIQTALNLKSKYLGRENEPKSPETTQGNETEQSESRNLQEKVPTTAPKAKYSFPKDDLLNMLVDLYFKNVNLFFPLLHRPTFDRLISEGLHNKSDTFGGVVLLVCANGARYSDDPRVLLDGNKSPLSRGWKWFDQVQMVCKSLLLRSALFDLQFYCLSVQFLQGSSAPQACWTMVGIGIRLAQDIGAHRRRARSDKPTVEDEQWKRAFWVLICLDRLVSHSLGRPCSIQDEDFDLDLPLEVDDEYWESPDPEKAFKQPEDKPSVISCFVSYLRLNHVLAFALRTIYSINKSQILLGFLGQEWEQQIVAKLDSALNQWLDSVPDHLRWDPNRENRLFFDQSVFLYSSYYHLQILIHRPFISSPRKPSPLSFPSLAICTNAARSCSHIVDIYHQRNSIPQPYTVMAVFTAGIVLLLNIWGGKRSGLSTDPRKEMADVYKCMQVLRSCEQRWLIAGRYWDILYELAWVGELPLPQHTPPLNNKRERDSDSPNSATPVPTTPPASSIVELPRHIAGSRRVGMKDSGLLATPQDPQDYGPEQLPQGSSDTYPTPINLPMYSDELGRLPLHAHIDFSSSNSSLLYDDPYSWYSAISDRTLSAQNMLSMTSVGASNPGSTAAAMQPQMDPLLYNQMLTTMSPYGQYYIGQDGQIGMHSFPAELEPQHFIISGRGGPPIMDNDTIAMWSNAPTGFEPDDWGAYLSDVSEMAQGSHTDTFHYPNRSM